MLRCSAFGKRLFAAADDVPGLTGAAKEEFEQEFTFVDRKHIRNLEPHVGTPLLTWSEGAKLCNRITAHVASLWGKAVFNDSLHVQPFLEQVNLLICIRKGLSGDMTAFTDEQLAEAFRDPVIVSLLNGSWAQQDALLWDRAADLDPKRPSARGQVARTFGLFDPQDPGRPICSDGYTDVFGDAASDGAPQSTPAPVAPPAEVYVETIPVAPATESLAKSGHAAAREAEEHAPKEKEKTRGTGDSNSTTSEATLIATSDVEDDVPEFPDLLPTLFKLGKKNLNVRSYACTSGSDS